VEVNIFPCLAEPQTENIIARQSSSVKFKGNFKIDYVVYAHLRQTNIYLILVRVFLTVDQA